MDFADCNLHVINYSTALHRSMSLGELRAHLFTVPNRPDSIPYRTAYEVPGWGFCMRHRDFERLADGTYEVLIASEHRSGHMSYGEHVVAGATRREFLLSAHACRPSLANDNCSGLAVLSQLARTLAGRRLRYTYRFLFAPGTVGAMAWLARNEERSRRIDHGLVVSCLGDGGGPTYKCSRRGEAEIDRAMRQMLSVRSPAAIIREFEPYGDDERQFCSPGYDLPVGLFQRSAFGDIPRTSYLERRSGLHPSGSPRGLPRHDTRGDRHHRGRLDAAEPAPKGEPQSAVAASTAASAADRSTQTPLPCSGS